MSNLNQKVQHNADNISFLSSSTTINSEKISEVNETVSANIAQLQDEDINLWDSVLDNRNAIEVAEVPIGTIISWVMMVDKNGGEVAPLPENWQKCDGSVITHGIWEGKYTPNLNGEKRFLRGGDDNDVLTLEDVEILDHKHYSSVSSSADATVHDYGHTHTTFAAQEDSGHSYDGDGGGGHIDNYSITSSSSYTGISVDVDVDVGVNVGYVTSSYRSGTETRPKNMNVVFIIRVS